MANFFTGTSGWAYASWKPEFYPAKLASAKFLQYYSSRLNTVEVNYSFRHLVAEKTLQNWIAATPSEFKFSLKANQRITHIKKLKGAAEDARRFLDSLQPLAQAGKLGPVLFQLPPFLKADVTLLEDFLAALPRSGRFSFEFRHVSWFNDHVLEILRKHNVALCVAESETLETPDAITSDFCYYRLRKGEYSEVERKATVDKIKQRLARGDVFVYYKHEETPEGARYAEELFSAMKAM